MLHDGHRERLRNRYRREGLSGFAPHEILELLLTFAIPRIDTNPLAHELLSRFGSLPKVLEATPEELEQVPGIGPQAATLLTMIMPLFRAYEQEKFAPGVRLNTYAELSAYCRSLFLGVRNEQMYLLCFDAKLKLLAATLIAQGTPAEVSVLPRQIMQELMRHNAVGAVITHNHPSGSPKPSQEDMDLTEAIQQMLGSVGIRLYDHVIIAGNVNYSFAANRMLGAEQGEEDAFDLAADRPQHRLPARRKGEGR